MDDDDAINLIRLNIALGEAEATGDREHLEEVIGAELVFRRADGTVVDRAQFLEKVGPGKARHTEIESVAHYGNLRAVVTCVVRLGEERTPYHNIRMFHRATVESPWKLLAWANEPA